MAYIQCWLSVGLFVAALGSCWGLPAGYSFLDVAYGLHELFLCRSPFQLEIFTKQMHTCGDPAISSRATANWRSIPLQPARPAAVRRGLSCSPHPCSSSSGLVVCKFQRNMPQPELGEKRLTLEHHMLFLPDSLWKGKIPLHTYTNKRGGMSHIHMEIA